MLKLNCDICGKPATVHEIVTEAGEVTSFHLCQEHGELRVIEVYYRRSLSEAEWESVARIAQIPTNRPPTLRTAWLWRLLKYGGLMEV